MSAKTLLLAVITVLLLGLSLSPVVGQAPIYGAAGMEELTSLGCQDLVTVGLSGFRPGTVIFVYASYREQDCFGSLWQNHYFQSVGAADAQGQLSYTFVHNGKGQYDYWFFDSYGGLARVGMNTVPMSWEALP